MTCTHLWATNGEGHEVCLNCGLIDESTRQYVYSVPEFSPGHGGSGQLNRRFFGIKGFYPGHTYCSLYHVNERVAQILFTGPEVPTDIMRVIAEEYERGRYKAADVLSKTEIARLCKNTKVPPALQRKYRSSKNPQNLMRSLTRFSERWYYIKRELCGKTLNPPVWAMRILIADNNRAQQEWNHIRHTKECTLPSPLCHKEFGCRKNFPNFYYIMHQLCRRHHFTELLPLFPITNKPDRLRALDDFWQKICLRLNWTWKPLSRKARSMAPLKRKATSPLKSPPRRLTAPLRQALLTDYMETTGTK